MENASSKTHAGLDCECYRALSTATLLLALHMEGVQAVVPGTDIDHPIGHRGRGEHRAAGGVATQQGAGLRSRPKQEGAVIFISISLRGHLRIRLGGNECTTSCATAL